MRMDDRELESLFREAPGDTPAPSFDATDIASRSRKATTRKRSIEALTLSFGVLVLAGLGTIGVLVNMDLSGEETGVAGSAASDNATEFGTQEQPEDGSGRLPSTGPAQGFPDASPKQGGDAQGESTSGCDQVDRKLAIALAGELPVAVPVTEAEAGRLCSPGWRSAAFQVRDGVASGIVSATVVPPGTTVQLAEQPEGTVLAEQRTASGATVLVLSVPDAGGMAPFADAVESIAAELAARY
jgi:hypothetical protein